MHPKLFFFRTIFFDIIQKNKLCRVHTECSCCINSNELQCSPRMHEAWLPAQHDSGSSSHLATLNAEADNLARRGLHTASPGTLPWAALYHGRIVALRDGAPFLP